MTIYKFGDVILVPFPFTDQTATKRRPAVVISSTAYNLTRSDLILIAVTTQVRKQVRSDEIEVVDWLKAGLLKPSVIKPVVTTIEKTLVLKQLGKLETADAENLRDLLQAIVG